MFIQKDIVFPQCPVLRQTPGMPRSRDTVSCAGLFALPSALRFPPLVICGSGFRADCRYHHDQQREAAEGGFLAPSEAQESLVVCHQGGREAGKAAWFA